MSKKSMMQMVQEALDSIENLSPNDVAAELAQEDVLLIDLREEAERQADGVISGAIHVPRGVLEFYADPDSEWHQPYFDPQKRVILHCSAGLRSALAAITLQELGYSNVAHLKGGTEAWREAGQTMEPGGS